MVYFEQICDGLPDCDSVDAVKKLLGNQTCRKYLMRMIGALADEQRTEACLENFPKTSTHITT